MLVVNAAISMLNANATIKPMEITTTLPWSRKFLKPLITTGSFLDHICGKVTVGGYSLPCPA
jgi:hypothetical protein